MTTPDWNQMCLGLETVDSVEKSLRRKRAIEMTSGDQSEEYTFKGYMAAMGCLILFIVLAGFMVLAVVEGFRMPLRESAGPQHPRDETSSTWPLWMRLWPVYPLIVFLLFQFLLRVARKSDATSKGGM